jgi:hypothetical protein
MLPSPRPLESNDSLFHICTNLFCPARRSTCRCHLATSPRHHGGSVASGSPRPSVRGGFERLARRRADLLRWFRLATCNLGDVPSFVDARQRRIGHAPRTSVGLSAVREVLRDAGFGRDVPGILSGVDKVMLEWAEARRRSEDETIAAAQRIQDAYEASRQ